MMAITDGMMMNWDDGSERGGDEDEDHDNNADEWNADVEDELMN